MLVSAVVLAVVVMLCFEDAPISDENVLDQLLKLSV